MILSTSPPALQEVHPSKPAPKTRTVLAVLVLLGLTLAFYYGLWLPGLVLIKRDAYGFWLPLKQHMIERLAAGELPQWFPYEALGRPFIGTAATGIFHPFTALYFLLPAPDAYRVSTLLSCLLAAVGAFTLGRTLNFSREGALVAGVAFALSGYVVSFTEHLIYLYSICILPSSVPRWRKPSWASVHGQWRLRLCGRRCFSRATARRGITSASSPCSGRWRARRVPSVKHISGCC